MNAPTLLTPKAGDALVRVDVAEDILLTAAIVNSDLTAEDRDDLHAALDALRRIISRRSAEGDPL